MIMDFLSLKVKMDKKLITKIEKDMEDENKHVLDIKKILIIK